MNAKEKRYEIALKAGFTPGMLSHLIKGRHKTLNVALAIAAAEITGKRPSDYLSDKIKALAIDINPKLNKAIRA